MGIDTDVRKQMRTYYAREAWHESEKTPLENYVRIDDMLTRLHQAIGPNYNHMFTGVQLYTEVMRTVRTAFDTGCSVYIAICDDSTHVPREKGDTQAQRSRTSSNKPYELLKGYSFTDGGLREDGPEATDELVDIRRLMATRALRRHFCHFVALKALENEDVPNGKTFIFDYDSNQHPVILPKHRDTPAMHVFGEADLAMFYWAEIYHDRDVIFTTVDTDIIPISTDYVYSKNSIRVPSTKMYWRYEKQSYVDIRMMLSKTLQHLQLSPGSFKLFCVLTGTDFFDKSQIMFKFGLEKILNAVQSCRRYWPDVSKRFERRDNARNALMIILFDMYGKYVVGTLGHYLERTVSLCEELDSSSYSPSSSSASSSSMSSTSSSSSSSSSSSLSSSSLPALTSKEPALKASREASSSKALTNTDSSSKVAGKAYGKAPSNAHSKASSDASISTTDATEKTTKKRTSAQASGPATEKSRSEDEETTVNTSDKKRIFDWALFEQTLHKSSKFPKSFRLPNDATAMKAVDRIMWNLEYWCTVPVRAAENNNTVSLATHASLPMPRALPQSQTHTQSQARSQAQSKKPRTV